MSIIESASKGLDSVKSGRSYLDGLANKYVVKPAKAQGIDGWVFDYEGDSTINLASEITDHYVEDNISIQDHVALKPRRVTLRGYVGELVMHKPEGLLGALGLAQSSLTQLYAYLGDDTPQMVQQLQQAASAATAAVNAFDQGLARAQNLVGMFSKAVPPVGKQEAAYLQLEQLWASKQIVTVQTPFKYFLSMAIELVTFVQDPETKTMTDIAVTLKEIRQASVEFTTYSFGMYSGRADQQRQPLADQGKDAPAETAPSMLYNVFNSPGK